MLMIEDLTVEYAARRRLGQPARSVSALSGVSLEINQGETLGVVGETGCGKTTMASAVIQLVKPNKGRVVFCHEDLVVASPERLRVLRADIQMVVQDPFSSMDPRWSVKRIVAEPMLIHRIGVPEQRRQKADELLSLVGLDPLIYSDRKPRQLSGGQCQRVAIARALAVSPKLLICDEIVSSLDVSVQAQILNLLLRLREELGIAYLFISHDLAVVRHISDRVAVMYMGRVAEIGPSEGIYTQPLHPYTDELLGSVPGLEVDDLGHAGEVSGAEAPSAMAPPSGCRYRMQCPKATVRCADEIPHLREIRPGHSVACHFPRVGNGSS